MANDRPHATLIAEHVLPVPQSLRAIQWCRDGYHCTCHPNRGGRCCRCGTAHFDEPAPGAGLDPEDACAARGPRPAVDPWESLPYRWERIS